MDSRVVGTTSTHCNRGGRHPGTRDLTKPSEQTLGAGRQDSCFPFADENEAERLSDLPKIAVLIRTLFDSGDHALDLKPPCLCAAECNQASGPGHRLNGAMMPYHPWQPILIVLWGLRVTKVT